MPTMFTLGNLVCGFFAIVVASRIERPDASWIDASRAVSVMLGGVKDPTNVMLSAWLIFLAMIFDALDGYVARWANAASDFGAQLDSLCDVVTFGVAPGILLVKMCPNFTYLHREAVWVIAAAFAACAALRLARFNVETTDDDDHMSFHGLPSPAGGAAIASFAILFYTLRKEDTTLVYAAQFDIALQMVLPLFAVLVAVLMVSRIPYPHVVNQVLRGERSFGHVVALLFALVVVMVIRGYAVPIVCVAFALSGPIRYVWQEFVQRKPHEDPLF
ncbi:MAG: CDP-diacylglycerol--serine O-phosphatidyltransferase [Pirellulales bacterium]|nr:CDP-diacylglycerol--serine O-phosphatidyltransferase [Pirellulales bacterium]